jgi:bifunctional DNA-binding transcriptional regulator/antitoxin component of YhaV-PrlF toxin-antitoxin module
MPTYRVRVRSDGELTLPRELADKLKIREGADVEFFLSLEGDVFFHAITGQASGWKDLFPIELRSPPLSIREMDERMVEGLVEDDERIRRQASEASAVADRGQSAAE